MAGLQGIELNSRLMLPKTNGCISTIKPKVTEMKPQGHWVRSEIYRKLGNHPRLKYHLGSFNGNRKAIELEEIEKAEN